MAFADAVSSPLFWTHICFPFRSLARLYHMRWDIETFYRDFKHTLTLPPGIVIRPFSFHQELLMHMIALCLIRTAMLEAARLGNVSVGQLSFARALTEIRLFLNSYCPPLKVSCGLHSGQDC